MEKVERHIDVYVFDHSLLDTVTHDADGWSTPIPWTFERAIRDQNEVEWRINRFNGEPHEGAQMSAHYTAPHENGACYFHHPQPLFLRRGCGGSPGTPQCQHCGRYFTFVDRDQMETHEATCVHAHGGDENHAE